MRARTCFALFAVIFLALALRPAVAAEMVALSDLHFDPTADQTLVDQLAASPPERWAAILANGRGRMSIFGQDANWKLLDSALAAAKAQPTPDLVLVTGDFFVHSFPARFDAASATHGDAAFHAFAVKTLRFIALQLEATFPGTPVLPVLGNNDTDCEDYELRPGGAFLADTAATVAELIGPKAGESVRQSWSALGNYVVPNPAAKDQLIAVVNTNFFSPHYRNGCGTPADGDPATATLAWLRGVLADAEAAHRKVALAFHIPPGIDAPATARRDACPISPVPMFAEPYGDQFHTLMAQYRDTVTASFAGHTHMDGFRLLREGGKSFAFVLMNPAISPIYGQSPAFRRIILADDGNIADQSVYYLTNLAEAATGAAPRWQLEMSFDATWNLPRFDLANLDELYRRIGTTAAARDRWLDLYAVQGPGRDQIKPSSNAIYRCTAGNDRAEDVAACSCTGAAP